MAFKLALNLRALAVLTLTTVVLVKSQATYAEAKWEGQVPTVAQKPEDWTRLLSELTSNEMYYGSVASARNMLNFFSDLPTKELAYKTIVKWVDLGYPYSTRGDFVAGDLDPSGSDGFTQSYLLYKGMVNHDKKMEKWADYYFGKVNKETFPKYLFFRATETYMEGKPTEAIPMLSKALAGITEPEGMTLAKKVARTLARIHYELGHYEKSLEIYESFLLKVSPLTPSDWVETSWNLYQLKRFPEALGMLYNLESKAIGSSVLLEKYVLRGLIYREFCSVTATDQLIKSFDKEFGAAITGIKMGEPLANYPQLVKIDHPDAQEFRQYTETIKQLESEAKRIASLPSAVRALATYVYQSEISMLNRRRQYFEDHALEALARHLVILGESLRFLRFDVARERFNPDRVFAEPVVESPKLVDDADAKNFRLHWLQWGDFWRDERALYRGVVSKKCDR